MYWATLIELTMPSPPFTLVANNVIQYIHDYFILIFTNLFSLGIPDPKIRQPFFTPVDR